MVARYAPPISYNFLNLIRLDVDRKTIFEKVSRSLYIPWLSACFTGKTRHVSNYVLISDTNLASIHQFCTTVDIFNYCYDWLAPSGVMGWAGTFGLKKRAFFHVFDNPPKPNQWPYPKVHAMNTMVSARARRGLCLTSIKPNEPPSSCLASVFSRTLIN